MRYAVILTHDRPDLLVNCINSIGPQVDRVIVLDNASDPPVDLHSLQLMLPAPRGWTLHLFRIPDQPPNLSRLWNTALGITDNFQSVQSDTQYHVAFLCDDTAVPPGWFGSVEEAMILTGAVAGCSNPWGGNYEPILKTEPDADLGTRMPGWAFILNGHSELRADERLHWWWCDTDLDWRARKAGGMVMISGYPVHNIHPNDYTVRNPELAQQAGEDGVTFQQIWGWRPW